MLDVGCGTKPRGDVNVDFFGGDINLQVGNQIQGDHMFAQKIRSFVMADATHIPFKNESFNVVFSSHAIEHVAEPFAMFRELCRVARRKVIVRCPHRKGGGAVMPYHLNHFDESWFKKATDVLGLAGYQFVTIFDYPISSKFEKTPLRMARATLPWRALKRFERRILMKRIHVPWEVEAWVRKHPLPANTDETLFVVVYNLPGAFKNYFSSSPYIADTNVASYHNANHKPIPEFYNETIQKHLNENVWFIFCHQDFILNEDLQKRLKTKDTQAVYGPIGGRVASNTLIGSVTQRDGTTVGCKPAHDMPVQTLDEMCLIVHSSALKQGLLFDEHFPFHFYGADFCMQAYTRGFDILAMPLKCQHKSRTIHGDVNSPEYLASRDDFGAKWKQYLPIKTTTALLT